MMQNSKRKEKKKSKTLTFSFTTFFFFFFWKSWNEMNANHPALVLLFLTDLFSFFLFYFFFFLEENCLLFICADIYWHSELSRYKGSCDDIVLSNSRVHNMNQMKEA